MGRQTSIDIANLVWGMRDNADAIARDIQALRKVHPERMSEYDWRNLRANYLLTMENLRKQILLTADLYEKLEASRERGYS